ncbi:MAG: MFS transporter [Elusimicrobia bacterium]|nr:MFS transporter [Elusimicrobiota bacterium]
MFRSLRYRNFRLFFFGQFVSLTGSWIQHTAQAWLVYRLTHDPFMLGLVAFLSQFPVFVFGLVSGVAIDRTNRLTLLRWTQAFAMAQSLILAALTLTGAIEVWHILILSFLLGVVGAFDMPARQVFVGEIVAVEDRHNAIALNSTITNASRMVGPALAGLLIAVKGEGFCFAINALSFMSVLGALFMIRGVAFLPKNLEAGHWDEIKRGMVYARGHAGIRILLLVLAAFSVAGMPFFVLLPVYAGDILHAGPEGLGLLTGASGLGSTIGALALARRGGSHGLASIMERKLAVFALGLALFAFSTHFWLSMLLALLLGWAAIYMVAGTNTLLQELSVDEFRGRVMSFFIMVFIGLSPLGSFGMGHMASRLGAPLTTMLAACVCALAAVVCHRRLRKAVCEGLPPLDSPPTVSIPTAV